MKALDDAGAVWHTSRWPVTELADALAQTTDALGKLAKANSDSEAAHRSAEEAQMRLRDAIDSINEGFVLFDADDRLVEGLLDGVATYYGVPIEHAQTSCMLHGDPACVFDLTFAAREATP